MGHNIGSCIIDRELFGNCLGSSLGTPLESCEHENCHCYPSRAHQVVCNKQVGTVFNFTMGHWAVCMIMSCCTTNYQLFNLQWLLSVEDLPDLCEKK